MLYYDLKRKKLPKRGYIKMQVSKYTKFQALYEGKFKTNHVRRIKIILAFFCFLMCR
jgi:hypothetical protein